MEMDEIPAVSTKVNKLLHSAGVVDQMELLTVITIIVIVFVVIFVTAVDLFLIITVYQNKFGSWLKWVVLFVIIMFLDAVHSLREALNSWANGASVKVFSVYFLPIVYLLFAFLGAFLDQMEDTSEPEDEEEIQ